MTVGERIRGAIPPSVARVVRRLLPPQVPFGGLLATRIALDERPLDPVLAVIPVFGRDDLTHAVIGDLTREAGVDVLVVDNRGDYTAIAGERVLRPGSNLGWAGGTKLGIESGLDSGNYAAFLALNNDTRLSRGFVRGLVRCQSETGAGLVGPFYDCFWPHQRLRRPIPPDRYFPRRRHFVAPFIDGTAMLIPFTTVAKVGQFDATSYGPFGYGAEIDYSARVWKAGLTVAVTRLSYLHHERASTGKQLSDDYEAEAFEEAIDGLQLRWGQDWRRVTGLDVAWGPNAKRRRAHRIRQSVRSTP
jgi:hypothetical protein